MMFNRNFLQRQQRQINRFQQQALYQEELVKSRQRIRQKVQAKREEWRAKIAELFKDFPKDELKIQAKIAGWIADIEERACTKWGIVESQKVDERLAYKFEKQDKGIRKYCKDYIQQRIRPNYQKKLEGINSRIQKNNNAIKSLNYKKHKKGKHIRYCMDELKIYKKILSTTKNKRIYP